MIKCLFLTLVQIEGYIHWRIKKITVIAVEASTLNCNNLISTVANYSNIILLNYAVV